MIIFSLGDLVVFVAIIIIIIRECDNTGQRNTEILLINYFPSRNLNFAIVESLVSNYHTKL